MQDQVRFYDVKIGERFYSGGAHYIKVSDDSACHVKSLERKPTFVFHATEFVTVYR